MQEALLAAQNAVHSIFDARSAGARLAAAGAGSGAHRPHSAQQQGVAFHTYVSGVQLTASFPIWAVKPDGLLQPCLLLCNSYADCS